MALDDALRQRGFRRWYERQLIEAHAYLASVKEAAEAAEDRARAAEVGGSSPQALWG
jgi:hypothetical protein